MHMRRWDTFPHIPKVFISFFIKKEINKNICRESKVRQ